MPMDHEKAIELLEQKLILRRYSHSTIKTYKSMFRDFFNYGQFDDVDFYDKEEIRRYLMHLISQGFSRSMQNQWHVSTYIRLNSGCISAAYLQKIEQPIDRLCQSTILRN